MQPRKILLHGFFSGPKLWQPVVHRLRQPPRTADIVALPFHGGPEAADFAACCARMWQSILQSSSHTSEPVHLVGYSLGARMALTMACMAPHRVAKLTLIGVHPGLTQESDRQARRQADSVWQQRLIEQPLPDVAKLWDTQPLFAPRDAMPQEARAAVEAARQHLRGAQLAQSLAVLGLGAMPPLQTQLKQLPIPTQLLAGALDTKFVRLAQELTALMPHAAAHIIAHAHHDVVLSHPDAVAQALEQDLTVS